VIVGLVTFTIARATPGGPFDTDPNRPGLSRGAVQRMQQQFGLNLPLWRQFTRYMFFDIETVVDKKTKQEVTKFVPGAMLGNLGPTYASKGSRSVQDTLFKSTSSKPSKFGYSARLGVQAIVIAVLIALPLGIIAALRQNSWIDYLVLAFSTALAGIPALVFGLLIVIVFSVWLKWFPVRPDWDNAIQPWILPTLALAVSMIPGMMRLTRYSVLEVKRQDYVRTAQAKGLRDWVVVMRHVLKNALLPIITILGPLVAGLVTGTLFIERIFQVPGMGGVLVESIGRRDYSMILGGGLIYTVLLVVCTLVVDLIYGVIDPRISLK
jgi:oligopeptide transport system permease protein